MEYDSGQGNVGKEKAVIRPFNKKAGSTVHFNPHDETDAARKRIEEKIRNATWARNPYALAEAYLKRSIRWDSYVRKYGSTKVRDKISNILECDYQKLFDPIYPSPLFYGRPDTYKSRSCPCEENPRHWGEIPTTVFFSGTDRANLSTTIDDPIQGCLPNCYLIAALCSLAWTIPLEFPPTNISEDLPHPPETIDLNFYRAGSTVPSPFSITSEIPLDGNNKPVFARPSLVNEMNLQSELWVSLYEKAYGYFKGFSKSPLQSDYFGWNHNYPDLTKFREPPNDQGHPLLVLQQLTGKAYIEFKTATRSTAQIWTDIFPNCQSRTIPFARTTKPMAAWTYPSGDLAPGVNKPVYNNEVIVANHAYSILGTISGNPQYIVLRNPYGQLWGLNAPPADPMENLITDPELVAGFYRGNNYKIADAPRNAYFDRSLSVVDGIFGLKIGMFKKYFAGYGWVV